MTNLKVKKCIQLCEFFKNQGYKSQNRNYDEVVDAIAERWQSKPYAFMTDDLTLLFSYVDSRVGADEDSLYEVAFFLALTHILDFLTLKPSAGFYGRSNSSKLKNKKQYYNRKVFNKMKAGMSLLESIKFSKEDKIWLQGLHQDYSNLADSLGNVVEEIGSRSRSLKLKATNAAGWLIQHFDEKQVRLSFGLIPALIEDLQNNRVMVHNKGVFLTKNLKANIGYVKSTKWLNDDIANDLKLKKQALE